MIHFCAQQYLLMEQELILAKSKQNDLVKQIEQCYGIADKYWIYVKKEMKNYRFKDKKEEILFFKGIKPKFLAEKEYYSLLYHASLFAPLGNAPEEMEFWIRESGRFDKFIKENESFYLYLKSGCTDKDEVLFLGDELGAEGPTTVSYAQLVASIMALEKYNAYVLTKLEGKKEPEI